MAEAMLGKLAKALGVVPELTKAAMATTREINELTSRGIEPTREQMSAIASRHYGKHIGLPPEFHYEQVCADARAVRVERRLVALVREGRSVTGEIISRVIAEEGGPANQEVDARTAASILGEIRRKAVSDVVAEMGANQAAKEAKAAPGPAPAPEGTPLVDPRILDDRNWNAGLDSFNAGTGEKMEVDRAITDEMHAIRRDAVERMARLGVEVVSVHINARRNILTDPK